MGFQPESSLRKMESWVGSNSDYCGVETSRLTVESDLPRGELIILSERSNFRKDSKLMVFFLL